MTSSEILSLLEAEPFRPFHLVTKDGLYHPVLRKDLCMVVASDYGDRIHLFQPGSREFFAKGPEIIGLVNITRTEPIVPEASPQNH